MQASTSPTRSPRPAYATGGSQPPRACPTRRAALAVSCVPLHRLSPYPSFPPPPVCARAQDSSYALPELARALRPLWITPASACFPYVAQEGSSFLLVICVSASRAVDAGTERRMGESHMCKGRETITDYGARCVIT